MTAERDSNRSLLALLIADSERDDYEMRTVGNVCMATNSASGGC
jgi:hypothetical protein